MKLYKYLAPSVLSSMFGTKGLVGLKCDFPKNYNDPFELFLGVDASEASREDLAYYVEILGEIPQMPTTCFSRRPDVIPMWAHYGRDHSGYVVEIDEERLGEGIAVGYIEDIAYSSEMALVDLQQVNFAATTGKFRHTHQVQAMAFRSAYLTKNQCWAYEMERRLIVNPNETIEKNGVMILQIPATCVTAIISGVRTTDDNHKQQQAIAADLGCRSLRMMIGRESITPFFVNDDNSYTFQGQLILPADYVCDSCPEPIYEEEKLTCNWCSVDDEMRGDAAFRNPLRMLYHLGLASEYGFRLAGLRPIGREVAKEGRSSTSEDDSSVDL